MTYEEFEDKLKCLDECLALEMKGDDDFYVLGGDDEIMARVTGFCRVITDYDGFIGYSKQLELYDLLSEVARTPIINRVKEKRNYYRQAWETDGGNTVGYLAYHIDYGDTSYQFNFGREKHKMKFTKKEYEELAKSKGIPDGFHVPEENAVAK